MVIAIKAKQSVIFVKEVQQKPWHICSLVLPWGTNKTRWESMSIPLSRNGSSRLGARASPRFHSQIPLVHILQKAFEQQQNVDPFKWEDATTRWRLLGGQRSHKAFPHFWKCVNKVLRRYNCKCTRRHFCELRNCWTTPPSLVALLQKHFSLEVEGMGDALHHSTYLNEWYSLYPEDTVFGAKHDFFKQDLRGKNTYVNPPFNTFEGKQNLIERVLEKILDSLRSDLPTRVILLFPSSRER